jgi:hypothetical protein
MKNIKGFLHPKIMSGPNSVKKLGSSKLVVTQRHKNTAKFRAKS